MCGERNPLPTKIASTHNGHGLVAHIYTRPEHPDEMTANARLIAAAPDLLAALQFALENLELANPIVEQSGHVTSIPSAMRKAEAAIAKATL
jgi:hypothetical protein